MQRCNRVLKKIVAGSAERAEGEKAFPERQPQTAPIPSPLSSLPDHAGGALHSLTRTELHCTEHEITTEFPKMMGESLVPPQIFCASFSLSSLFRARCTIEAIMI
jgi:hypothetical protein